MTYDGFQDYGFKATIPASGETLSKGAFDRWYTEKLFLAATWVSKHLRDATVNLLKRPLEQGSRELDVSSTHVHAAMDGSVSTLDPRSGHLAMVLRIHREDEMLHGAA